MEYEAIRQRLHQIIDLTFPFYDLSLYSCDIAFSTP